MFSFMKSKRNGKMSGAGRLLALNQPTSPMVEAFRALRTNISLATADSPIRAILISSPAAGEGKSTVIANLGMVMAQAGAKVLILDADLRNPVQDQIFSLDNSTGLSDAIIYSNAPVNLAQEGPVQGLFVMTSGPASPNPAELLASKSMVNLLADLKNQYEVILIDSPPIMAVTDAVLLASRVDGVVMVVRSGVTRMDVANKAIEQLKKANERFLGVILNQVTAEDDGYPFYNYRKTSQRI